MFNVCFQVQGGHGWYLFYLSKAVPELYLPQGVVHWLCDSQDAVSSRGVTDKEMPWTILKFEDWAGFLSFSLFSSSGAF